MPIYETKIVGRTLPLLINAESSAKVREAIVEATALTRSEVTDAFIAGRTIWDPATPMPADEPAPEPEAEAGEESEQQVDDAPPAGDAARTRKPKGEAGDAS